MLNVILSIVMLNVIVHNVVMLNDIMMIAVKLSVVWPGVVMLSKEHYLKEKAQYSLPPY